MPLRILCSFDPSNIATQGPRRVGRRLGHIAEVEYAWGRAKREIRIELLDEPYHHGCAHGVAQAGSVAEVLVQ